MISQFLAKKLIPASLLSILVYASFGRLRSWLFGIVALVLYFWFVSAKTQGIMVAYFHFAKSLRVRLLAIFLSLATLGWFLGIFIFFNYFNGLTVFLAFLVNALSWSLVNVKHTADIADHEKAEDKIALKSSYARNALIFYLSLVIYGFYLLIKSKANGLVLSPWQIIDSKYVLVFLLATVLLGGLVAFSKFSLKTLLFLVIVHAFLLHSYLPLTHEFFYGADGWRHLATEQRLVDGKQFLEAKLSDSGNQQSKVAILKSKLGLLSYANFWGTNAVFSKILGINLISLTKWLLPIVWSIIFTILLYEFGLAFGWSGRDSLLLAWAGIWPFALQAGGSFSLPVNFGFLIFGLLFLLLIKMLKEPNRAQKIILLVLGVSLIFGYLLFFVLFWLSWGIMAVLKSGKKLFIIPSLILAPLVLPALELAGKFSQLEFKVNILAQTKQFLGNLSAIYLATGPRPHDIPGGNILFNQIPAQVFTPNFLTQFRWWLPALVLAAFIVVIWGIKQNKKDLVYRSVLAIFGALFVSYFLSFYLLAGEHLLSRRLDAVLAFLFVILLFYGLKGWFHKKHAVGLVVVILSLAITASYTLGPDTFTVKTSELQAAKYIWSQEIGDKNHCVLGDTYPLLALEAVSANEIIGGGFPIDANFAQPERTALYKQMNLAVNDSVLKTSRVLTKTDHCWLIGQTDNFTKQGILNGGVFQVFGDTAVVRYNTKY